MDCSLDVSNHFTVPATSGSISLYQARKHIKETAKTNCSNQLATVTDHTSSDIAFLSNRSSGNRRHRNKLPLLPSTPMPEPMHVRAQKRASKKSFSPSATPETAKIAGIVQERLANVDPVLVSLLADLEPPSSQEAFDCCMEKVRRSKRN